MKKNLILSLIGAALLWPSALSAELCAGPNTTLVRTFYLHRDSFNEVQAEAASYVTGEYWYNWDTYVSLVEKVGTTTINSGSDSQTGGASLVEFFDAPADEGTGTWYHNGTHQYICDGDGYTYYTSDTLTVNEPEIDDVPFVNALWYFGPGTPDAVPAHVGYQSGIYAFQFANLTFDKKCGGGDDCSGSVTWGEADDTENAISVTAGGVMSSTKAHSACWGESAVTATLDGWEIRELIFVNTPADMRLPNGTSVHTLVLGDGYNTHHPWEPYGTCGWAIPSMAINEVFGGFSEHNGASGAWANDPTPGNGDRYLATEWYFEDGIGAVGGVPAPVYTASGPPSDPYSYFTKLKSGVQEWFIGSETFGVGVSMFYGTLEWYQDHADQF